MCRCRRQQWQSFARVEVSSARVCRYDPDTDHGLPLLSRNEQVEQDRASSLFFHQHELEGTTPSELRGGGEPHRQHAYGQRTRGEGDVGYAYLRWSRLVIAPTLHSSQHWLRRIIGSYAKGFLRFHFTHPPRIE